MENRINHDHGMCCACGETRGLAVFSRGALASVKEGIDSGLTLCPKCGARFERAVGMDCRERARERWMNWCAAGQGRVLAELARFVAGAGAGGERPTTHPAGHMKLMAALRDSLDLSDGMVKGDKDHAMEWLRILYKVEKPGKPNNLLDALREWGCA